MSPTPTFIFDDLYSSNLTIFALNKNLKQEDQETQQHIISLDRNHLYVRGKKAEDRQREAFYFVVKWPRIPLEI